MQSTVREGHAFPSSASDRLFPGRGKPGPYRSSNPQSSPIRPNGMDQETSMHLNCQNLLQEKASAEMSFLLDICVVGSLLIWDSVRGRKLCIMNSRVGILPWEACYSGIEKRLLWQTRNCVCCSAEWVFCPFPRLRHLCQYSPLPR